MVAYSFKSRFAEGIRTGRKSQTIRADRKRHARPGEMLQLFTGMRTRHCKLIAMAPCCAVSEIQLGFGEDAFVDVHGKFERAPAIRDFFARSDGFADWSDMEAFWRAEHEALTTFSGVLIQWNPKDLVLPPEGGA